jgi:hypothetical protein
MENYTENTMKNSNLAYSPPNNMWQQIMGHLWESQRQWQSWTHNHTALATNHRSLEVDKMPPRCIPSNSQSVPGTNHWPRLILQEQLLAWVTTQVVAIVRRCSYGMTTLRLYKPTSIIIQFFIMVPSKVKGWHHRSVLGEGTCTKDRYSKNASHTYELKHHIAKCNKQVTSKQQTRFSLTSIN